MLRSPVKVVMGVNVRWGIRRDMPAVVDIDARTHEYAWGEDDFLKQLRKRNTIIMVAEKGDRVLGYVLYGLYRDRIQIERMAVDPEFAGKGIGTRIIDKIKGKLHEGRRTRVGVEMRESNLDGLLFLKSMRFTAVGLTRGWFEDSGEDMIPMVYSF